MHQSFVMLRVLRRKQPRQVSNHSHTGPMQHPFLTAMPRSCTECQRSCVQKITASLRQFSIARDDMMQGHSRSGEGKQITKKVVKFRAVNK